jgi:hypothetical protein
MAIQTLGEVPPCLYCGSLEPRTDEHVLQAAFGTNIRLTEDVCGVCNTERFSAMDGCLVAYVRRFSEAKKHVADLPFKAEPFDGEIGFWLAPEAAFHIAVRAAGKGAPEHRDARLFAQIAFPDDGPPLFNGDSRDHDEETFAAMMRELPSPTTTIRVSAKRHNVSPVPPTLVRSGHGKYVLIAAPEDVDRVLARARAGFSEYKTTEARRVIHGPPMLHFNPTVHGGMILRALAKIAINFVCKVLGRALAETPELGPLRRAALGTPLQGDRGYVGLVPFDREPDQILRDHAAVYCGEKHHAIVLLPAGGDHRLMVTLYGHPLGVVTLPVAGQLRAAAVFDYTARTHEIYLGSSSPGWFRARSVEMMDRVNAAVRAGTVEIREDETT